MYRSWSWKLGIQRKKMWLEECFLEKPVQHWKIPWTCKTKQITFKFILHHPMMECTTQKTASIFSCFLWFIQDWCGPSARLQIHCWSEPTFRSSQAFFQSYTEHSLFRTEKSYLSSIDTHLQLSPLKESFQAVLEHGLDLISYIHAETPLSVLLSHPIPSLCCYHSKVQTLKGLYDVVGCNRENEAHQLWQSTPVFYSCPTVCPSICFSALCGHFFPWQMFLLPALAWLIFSPAVFVFAEYVLLCIHLSTSTTPSFGNSHLHSLNKNAINSLHPK